ncbi:hypothetical protein, partial [Bacillus sp. MM2020_4]|uniref:hypothetical protein n=1 Tax=Bacillus sp. MM2020_4 TaxID=2714039 RepID=UPI00140D626F
STVSAVTTRVTTAEQNISALDGKIALRVTKTEFDALQIGGRNLLRDSHLEKAGSNEYLMYADLLSLFDTHGIGQFTFSFDMKVT